VSRIEFDGWPVATAAEAQGMSRTTARKWLRQYRAEGWAGLEDRTPRPRQSPRSTRPAHVQAILQARLDLRWGPRRLGPLLGHPRLDTVYAVLARTGFSRLRDADRLWGDPVRYVRIPDGGGHRVHGRDNGIRDPITRG
jgi:transposase